ncbi:MAG: hypothetical protein JWO78_2341 [Micavibrio sp.]|nr:hypothetical protein [Micavibrio sp.]
MASYIHKMVGPDETLVGVARLHWIYLVKGMIGFAMCVLLAWAINTMIEFGLSLIYQTVTPPSVYPILTMNHYLSIFMFLAGVAIFGFYLVKVLGTEVGLTTRRLIFKEGLIFTTTHEVDIEEIRGERLDLGWFGRFLDYAYIKLDCRFIEDLSTPAIEKPERFIRALHKLRSEASDSVITIASHPDENGVHRAQIAKKGIPEIPGDGTVEALNEQKIPMTAPEIPDSQPASPVQPQPAMQEPIPPAPPNSVATPPIQPIIPQQQPLTQTPAEQASTLDPKVIAEVIHQAMPQIVEEMATHGLVAKAGHSDQPPIDPLLQAFDEASDEHGDTKKPRAVH